MPPTRPAVAARAALDRPNRDRVGAVARRLYDDLMAVAPDVRRGWYATLDQRDWDEVLRVSRQVAGTEYALWADDPVGFVEDVLGETTWSKQREVLTALTESTRVAVPSAFGVSKTHSAARCALWRSVVYPIGTSLTVTTATRFRQVQRQLWPHIRTCVARSGLPLVADQTQLRGYTTDGTLVDVAYGFSAPPGDEAAVQGIHFPRLMIVVDEAGGLSATIGEAIRGLLTGDETRLLAIGNPPTDDEGSWFEKLCADPKTRVVRISAYDAPLLSGERTRRCRTCPSQVPAHGLGVHLVDPGWVEDAIAAHGEDSRYVKAKVHARFPRGGPSVMIPADWVDAAVDAPDPADAVLSLADLVPEDGSAHMVQPGAWVRLGVDVAADGGDELVVARLIGDLATIEHVSSGSDNANAVDVAGKVLVQIQRAERVRQALGTAAKVRVKIDGIGVGWGVASVLTAWGSEGVHDAEIVVVLVSEDTYREADGKVMRPYRKRDEMWLTGRELLQPRPGTGRGRLRLRVAAKTAAQLSGPRYGTNSGGFTVVESKKSMKGRGLSSPDQAEAFLLSAYEPLSNPSKGVFRVLV